jgi:hypothetical protein
MPPRFKAICLYVITRSIVSNNARYMGYDKPYARTSDYIGDKQKPMISVSFTPEAAALVQEIARTGKGRMPT